ncbi:PREDICTED: zinc finger and SCAN domain-containing protein 5B-like [Ceratotherium simum simum]|uniref:Zinc finger and SCAN domain-containing protein 5B-like n=1 Tax=Ceratotherium simum simum TaxID=73337 RepID=A0ABM1DD27_CERSS|nr:PREDICTED: zinc finger and SCAN domain-containing protein 5B-like [Ceratotherium simum simum]
MAMDQTFSRGRGKSQDSPWGSELPPSLPSQGTLTEKRDCSSEAWHVSFRAFTSSEESDPVKDLRRLYGLCRLWLRPDLHTKEQILDKLVMEQFMISMPQELQVLVKESGVESCKDLENMLRNSVKPKKWTVVSLQGQKFLVQNSDAQMAEAEVSDMDDVRGLSRKPQTSVSEIYPENSQKVSQELGNPPGINEISRAQGQKVLLPETALEVGELEGLRPKQNLENDLMEDKEETKVHKSKDPQLLEGPADCVRAKGGKNPREETSVNNVDADIPSTHISEREVSTPSRNRRDSWKSPRSSKRRKQDNASICQEVPPEGASYLDKREFSGQLGSNSVHSPSAVGSTGLPVGKEATGWTPYECRVCKKRFHYKSQFDIHQRTHTGERPFRCNICPKGFMQSSDLRVHQRIHTGEKPYCCRLCLKKFTHDSTLRSHEKVHTKEKPYQCEDCEKAFSHRGNLNVHRRTHSGLKPYMCHQCHHAFRQLGTFKRHQKTHSKMTPKKEINGDLSPVL